MGNKISQLAKTISKVMGLAIATLPVTQAYAQSNTSENSTLLNYLLIHLILQRCMILLLGYLNLHWVTLIIQYIYAVCL